MRPREREEEATTPEPAPAATPAPAPRIGGSLSSMVVRPSESGGGSDHEGGVANRRRDSPSPDPRHRDSQPPPHRRVSPLPFRRRDSPSLFRRRGSPPLPHRRGSPPAIHRRDSPPAFPRRYSPSAFHRRGSPTNFHPRSQRFNDNSGYGMRGGFISPPRRQRMDDGYGMRGASISPPRRQRLDDSRYDPDFDNSVEPHLGRGFRGGRGGGGRFRDSSPHHGGRGGRPFGRGYSGPGRRLSPVEGEYVHRNDPNLSPREGDWICRNPSCGNLNFARRTYCNNCNQFRFEPDHNEFSRSPRRGYYSPSPYGSPPRISGPPMDRSQRDTNGYRSPPRRLVVDDSRDFGTGSPPPGRGERLPYHVRRERPAFRDEEFRGRGKFDWPVHEEWDRGDRRRDGPVPGRRGYDQRTRAPSPHDRWVRDSRERSRSPLGDRPLKGSYVGRGRGARRYDDAYMGRGQGNGLDAGRGRSFRQGDDSFIGRGRGDRPGVARGRNDGMY